MTTRVLVVGHCNMDGPWLQKEVACLLPGSEVVRVNSDEDLRRQCEKGRAVLLVNREPVGFDRTGIDIIRQVCAEFPDQQVMLVSDLADAQADAVKAGGRRGFGKRDVGTPAFEQTLREAVA